MGGKATNGKANESQSKEQKSMKHKDEGSVPWLYKKKAEKKWVMVGTPLRSFNGWLRVTQTTLQEKGY